MSCLILVQCKPVTKCIGVNISERKSGTERTKNRKKRESVFFCNGGVTGTVEQCLDATRICPSYDNLGYLYPGPYSARAKLQLNKQAKLTRFYKQIHGTIKWTYGDLVLRNTQFLVVMMLPTSQSELALPSTGSWLPSRLSST